RRLGRDRRDDERRLPARLAGRLADPRAHGRGDVGPVRDASSPAPPGRPGAVRARVSSVEVLEVVEPGLLTTVQDGGRPGLAGEGVSRGGAADPWSVAVANVLVGNPP